MTDYLPYCLSVNISNTSLDTPACRDQIDVSFLQLGLAGQANFLVTGDQDLLSPANEFACSIVTTEQFLQYLNDR